MLSGDEFYGTLCAVDAEAQNLTMQQANLLVVLGRVIATHIERDRERATRAAAEAEQARLYQLAQEAVREREALLFIASHELKNPLAAVLGYAHLLQRRMLRGHAVEERDERAVEMIVSQGEQLNRMLSDLLDVSRFGSGEVFMEQTPLDLSTLLHTVIEEMAPTLTAHPVAVEDSDSPVMVVGDEDRLAQVLRNLLGNAVKYSPDGGPIQVELVRDGGQARVTVQDHGIGIAAAALPNLFQRFYRAPDTGAHGIAGFGIGLYVVKEILARHGGTISVASTEGVGTTFTFTLPLLVAGS